MSEGELKCTFCGRKIDHTDYWSDYNGKFCDRPCMIRFEMGDKDKCANCNKKVWHSVLSAKDHSSGEKFYFCSEGCLNKFNDKRANNKLECDSRLYGGYWANIDEKK